MAIFEDEPGDYGDSGDSGNDAPPAPWEYEPELRPEIEQGEDRPVPEANDYEQPPEYQGGGEGGSGYGGGGEGGGEEPSPSAYGPVYPGKRLYSEPPPPKEPVDPNDWTQSERALQEKWIPQTDPGPLPPPYSTYYGPVGEQYGFFPQQPGIPESMFQQGKGWSPTPQFQETMTFTPDGYAELITSPSNWLIPQPQLRTGPKMPAPQTGRGGGGGQSNPSGPSIPPDALRAFLDLLRYGGIQRI